MRNTFLLLTSWLLLLGLVLIGVNHPTALAQEEAPPEYSYTPRPQGRIVGGQDATPGEWPWQALLNIDNQYQCGGSLIAPGWVLTAAHCISDGNQIAQSVQIRMGVHDNEDQNEATQQSQMASQIIAHPSYNPNTFDNDIALLRVAIPFQLNAAVQAVPWAASGAGDFSGLTAWATGWGTTSEGGSAANILQKVDLPVISNAQCSAWLSGITANMLCAGYDEGGKDACQGDSGGPLVTQVSGNWLLIGVTSWGDGCARPQSPGVWARVSQYDSWIQGHITPPVVGTELVYLPAVMVQYPAPPPSGGDAIVNGSFEQGATGWTQQSSNGYVLIVNNSNLPDWLTPRTGSWAAWLGGEDNEQSLLRQANIVVPASNPHLIYWRYVASSDECSFDYDWFGIFINQNNALRVDELQLCAAHNTNGWVQKIVSLNSFAGQTITIDFYVSTDNTILSNLFLDDVSLVSGSGGALTIKPLTLTQPESGEWSKGDGLLFLGSAPTIQYHPPQE